MSDEKELVVKMLRQTLSMLNVGVDEGCNNGNINACIITVKALIQYIEKLDVTEKKGDS